MNPAISPELLSSSTVYNLTELFSEENITVVKERSFYDLSRDRECYETPLCKMPTSIFTGNNLFWPVILLEDVKKDGKDEHVFFTPSVNECSSTVKFVKIRIKSPLQTKLLNEVCQDITEDIAPVKLGMSGKREKQVLWVSSARGNPIINCGMDSARSADGDVEGLANMTNFLMKRVMGSLKMSEPEIGEKCDNFFNNYSKMITSLTKEVNKVTGKPQKKSVRKADLEKDHLDLKVTKDKEPPAKRVSAKSSLNETPTSNKSKSSDSAKGLPNSTDLSAGLSNMKEGDLKSALEQFSSNLFDKPLDEESLAAINALSDMKEEDIKLAFEQFASNIFKEPLDPEMCSAVRTLFNMPPGVLSSRFPKLSIAAYLFSAMIVNRLRSFFKSIFSRNILILFSMIAFCSMLDYVFIRR